jgi:small-conductance mechanosensitive channel
MTGLTLDIGRFSNEFMIILRIVFIILGFILLSRLGNYLIDTLMHPSRLPGTWDERRVGTLRGLARSILKYTLYFLGAVTVLDELNFPITSILAGAGILGLAVGVGAQNLVRDVITGFFILFEDQYAVGDYVTVAGVTGTVQELGLRVTRIQVWTGEVHIIPNGKIEQVTNYSRCGMGVVLNVPVDYEVDLDGAIDIINGVCQEMIQENPDLIVEPVQVLGVNELDNSGVIIQVFGKVKPMHQWAFTRELRKRVKDAFDSAGIEFPYPHRVILYKQKKGGNGNGPAEV